MLIRKYTISESEYVCRYSHAYYKSNSFLQDDPKKYIKKE
uniref:Uncharacterized protein n=1 Tax=Arundo donax TaxID=35708 RepID=A0A0A9FC98_ARUDO